MKRRQMPLMMVVLLWFVFYVLTLPVFVRVLDQGDWVYLGHDGLPAPCPDGKGYWPRDCH